MTVQVKSAPTIIFVVEGLSVTLGVVGTVLTTVVVVEVLGVPDEDASEGVTVT